jgi:Glycosyl hydrolases family 16
MANHLRRLFVVGSATLLLAAALVSGASSRAAALKGRGERAPCLPGHRPRSRRGRRRVCRRTSRGRARRRAPSTQSALTSSGSRAGQGTPSDTVRGLTAPPSQTGVGATGPPTAAAPSGEPMPVGDLPGWHQVFADDFTDDVPLGGFSGCRAIIDLMDSTCTGLPPAVASKWWAYPDGWSDTSKHGRYYPSQVLSIHNGVLDYYVHTADGIPMVAAAVPKIPGGINGGGLRYGAFVVRFRADALPGYKAAWLLWPDSEIWPADGEIDFPEGNLDGTFSAFMHHMGASSGDQQDGYPTHASFTSWHTAAIQWAPGSCQFILDGTVIGTSTQFVPSDPMHWVLQVETALDGTMPNPATAGHVYIDWAVAYVPAG